MRLAGAACLVVALGCGNAAPTGPIRDVRPTKVERGIKMVVEGEGFDADAHAQVVFEGSFQTPDGRSERKTVKLAGRVTGPTRIILDADAAMEQRIGRAHFTGTVSVNQGDKTGVNESSYRYQIDFFPSTLRKATYGLIEMKKVQRISDWLGFQVAVGRDGLQVVSVVDAFNHSQFVDAFGKPPYNGEVSKADLGDQWPQYARLDVNGNEVVELSESEHGDREAGFAARAGLRAGDVITDAAGEKVLGTPDLFRAWSADVTQVDLTVKRGKEELSVVLPRHGAAPTIPDGFLAAGGPILIALLAFLILGPFSGLVVVAERRISAQMQSRIGPNRVGPQGLLQWLADALKMITKEDIIPRDADPILFRLSPYLVWMGVFGTFVILPLSQSVIVADLNVGILYLLSITSLAVVGIIMGGWASNSKWSLLGGMRSAAQIISYELPAGVAILVIVTMAGTLSPQGLILDQGGAPWHWAVFDNPMSFICFFIFFTSALAEGNRTPFDLPEAESELVSGYNTEYSGFRFGVYFLAEWSNLYVISAVATTVFLGGWRVPGVAPIVMESGQTPSALAFGAVGAALLLLGVLGWVFGRTIPFMRKVLWPIPLVAALLLGSMALGYQMLGFALFFLKAISLVFVIIWIRWTLPRFRVDQMMSMCWKYFIPASLACFILTAAWVWLAPSWLREGVRWVMFLTFGLGLFAFFVSRVMINLKLHRKRLWDPFAVERGP